MRTSKHPNFLSGTLRAYCGAPQLVCSGNVLQTPSDALHLAELGLILRWACARLSMRGCAVCRVIVRDLTDCIAPGTAMLIRYLAHALGPKGVCFRGVLPEKILHKLYRARHKCIRHANKDVYHSFIEDTVGVC